MKVFIKYWKAFLGIFLLVLAGFGVAATLQGNQEERKLKIAEAKKIILTSVETAKIQLSMPTQTLLLVGVLKPYQVLELASETDGKITEIYFELNQNVFAGQVLAKTDAQIKQTQTNITELNYKKAKRDFERMEKLFKNNNLPEIELENARFQMQNAEQNLQLNKQIISYSTITSPINGNISQKLASKGKFLQVGTPIAVITDISSLRLQVNIASQDLEKMKIGTKINIKIPSQNLENIIGVVRSISVQSNEAGSFPVEIIVPNNQKKQLLAGMQAEITANISAENNNPIMLIPRTALLQNKVFIVENGKAMAKKVVVGREFENEIEIISGLREGQEIVIKGQNNVENGQVIQIYRP
jgi:RND family efflux transporter MFP subunit